MALLRGQTVVIYNRIQTGVDALNAPVYEDKADAVDNILVCPASAEAVTDGLQLYGKRAVYELLIPKEDGHQWEDRKVSFFGQHWRTFGAELKYPDGLTPGPWNRRIKVERYG